MLPWIMPEVVRSITWKGLLDPMYGGGESTIATLRNQNRVAVASGWPGTQVSPSGEVTIPSREDGESVIEVLRFLEELQVKSEE